MVSRQHIGKESNPIKLITAEETDGALEGEEADMDSAQRYGDPVGLAHILSGFNIAALAGATRIPKRTLYRLRAGGSPRAETFEAVLRGLHSLADPSQPPSIG